MSGLVNKVKDAVGKGGSSSTGGETGHSSGGMGGLADKAQHAGMEKQVDNYAHKGIDQATDRVGMADKYDTKIDSLADKQIHNQMSGGKGI